MSVRASRVARARGGGGPRGRWRWVAPMWLGSAGPANVNCGWVGSGDAAGAAGPRRPRRRIVDFHNGSGRSGRRSRANRRRRRAEGALGRLHRPVRQRFEATVLPCGRYSTSGQDSPHWRMPNAQPGHGAGGPPARALCRFPTQPQLAGVATATRGVDLRVAPPPDPGRGLPGARGDGTLASRNPTEDPQTVESSIGRRRRDLQVREVLAAGPRRGVRPRRISARA